MPPPEKDPCSELQAAIAKLALNIGTRPGVKTLDAVLAEIQKEIPELTREELVESIVAATTGQARVMSEVAKQLAALKNEARVDRTTRRKIDELERHLAEGTLPAKGEPRADNSPEAIKALRSIRDELEKQLRQSEPAVRERLLASIDRMRERLETIGDVPPEARVKPELSPELERLAYERDRMRRRINDSIQNMRPKSFFHHAAQPLNLARTVMTSVDFSAVLRQGGFVGIGHPVRAARALPDMFRSLSDRAARRIDDEIRSRPNAPMYAKSELYLAELDGGLSKAEEAYRGDWASRIPLLKHVTGMSQRAYTTFLNRLRADSFDAAAQTLGRNGEFTLDEAKAISRYINIATGRGVPNRQVGEALTATLFSPRYVASRFQLLAGPATGFRFGGGSLRTRAYIARQYGQYLAGMGVIYGLAQLAGGELEWDPRSSDFGKIKIGDTRIDPLSGLAQTVVLLSRLGTGQRKVLKSGKVSPSGGAGQVTWDFLRSKLAPVPGALLDAGDIAAGRKPPPGHPKTYSQLGQALVTPMSFRDIHKAMVEHGVPSGTALGLLAIFGAGVQNYEPQEPTPAERLRAIRSGVGVKAP